MCNSIMMLCISYYLSSEFSMAASLAPIYRWESPVHNCQIEQIDFEWAWIVTASVIFFFILFFNFTILYWFCHISTWIHHRYTRVPHPEPSFLLLPHTIPLGRPSSPAPSIQWFWSINSLQVYSLSSSLSWAHFLIPGIFLIIYVMEMAMKLFWIPQYLHWSDSKIEESFFPSIILLISINTLYYSCVITFNYFWS